MGFFKSITKVDMILVAIGIIACFIDMSIGVLTFWVLFGIVLFLHRDAIYSFMGNLAYHNRNYTKAINWYKTCIKLGNCPPKKMNTYVFLEIKYGDIERAEKNFNKVLENRKFPEESFRELNVTKALLEWAKGDNNAALDILFKELEIQEQAVLFETISYILLADKQYERALEFSKEAYSKVPEDYIVTSNLGIAYYLNGEEEKAYKALKPLCDGGLQLLEPYYYVALYANSQGNKDEAIKALEKAIRLPETFIKLVSKNEIKELLKELKPNEDDNEAPKEIAASKDEE